MALAIRRAVYIDYYPCPTCTFDGIAWARAYPLDDQGQLYYCPTCKNKYTAEEVE